MKKILHLANFATASSTDSLQQLRVEITFTIIILIISYFLILLGMAGAILPILPGPPVSYAGLLTAHFFTPAVEFDFFTLTLYGILAIMITVLDYIMPSMAAKRLGASQYASWGAGIGLVLGITFPPFGLLIGAFLGAFIGELIARSDIKKAFRTAFGSFLGFMAGVFVKVAVSIVFLIHLTWLLLQT